MENKFKMHYNWNYTESSGQDITTEKNENSILTDSHPNNSGKT